MDLHAVVSGAIGAINPFVSAQYLKSTGTTTNPDGSRVPSYAAPVTVSVQAQELSFKDLQHVENLNLQGIMKSIYCPGTVQAVNRLAGTGGDKIVIAGETYLVVAISEQWPEWCRVIGQLQVNA